MKKTLLTILLVFSLSTTQFKANAKLLNQESKLKQIGKTIAKYTKPVAASLGASLLTALVFYSFINGPSTNSETNMQCFEWLQNKPFSNYAECYEFMKTNLNIYGNPYSLNIGKIHDCCKNIW